MFRKLDALKAMQAITVLMHAENVSAMGRMRLLKLLYIAERELLRETGRSLLGCKAVAMKRGPLHSAVLDLINGKTIEEPKFHSHFSCMGYRVVLGADPGVSELSRFEVGKLQEVAHRYCEIDDEDLADTITHAFDEWRKNYVEGTSTPIPLSDILEAVGRGEDKDLVIDDERERAEFDRLFDPAL
jgi:uncharacterized phage-associated protein